MAERLLTLDDIISDPTSNFLNQFPDDPDSPYLLNNFSCEYLCLNEFNTLHRNNSNVSFMTINIQSLPAKFNDLRDLIIEMIHHNSAPSVICLQEIWRFPNNVNFDLPGYNKLMSKQRSNNVQGGGVAIYVKEGIKCTVSREHSIFTDRIFESIFVDLCFPHNYKCTVGAIYRPTAHPNLTPTVVFETFMDIFSNLLNSLTNSCSNLFILGDFNLDVANYTTNHRVSEYVDLLFSYGLLQIVTQPTRCTSNSASIIDHIITGTNQSCFRTAIITSKISDHFPIVTFIDATNKSIRSNTRTFRDYSEINMNNFRQALSETRWNLVRDAPDVQTSYNSFSDIFNNLFYLHFPLKTTKLKLNTHKLEPWFTNGLLISRKQKFILSAAHSKNPSPFNKLIYTNYRNMYNKTLRAAKKLYFDIEFKKCRSNLKRTWDLIRCALNTQNNSKDVISELNINGTSVSDPKLIADNLNEFFINAPQRIAEEIPQTINLPNPTVHPTENPFTFSIVNSPVTATEILDATAQLEPKKSEDLYGVSMFFIKKFISILVDPLYHVVSKSFETGKFPSQLKIAKIVPLQIIIGPYHFSPIFLK